MGFALDTSAVFLPPIIFVLPAKLFIITVKTKNTTLAYLRPVELFVEVTIIPSHGICDCLVYIKQSMGWNVGFDSAFHY